MGTAELSSVCLEALLGRHEWKIVAAVTQPDRPSGRALKLEPTPVKQMSLCHAVPVLQPERAKNPEFLQQLCDVRPDLIVVAAYGQILPSTILDLPKFGCINVHTSLLPKYRGAAPIQWAILNDEAETGVTIMKMDLGMDTGDILIQQRTPIQDQDDGQTLHDRLAQMGSQLLLATISDYVAGRIKPIPQDNQQASYAPKMKKQDGRLDWNKPARKLWNQVRGLAPWPGAFTFLPNQILLKIARAEVAPGTGQPGAILAADKSGIAVACGENALRLLELQRQGGRQLSARDFLAGHPLSPGQILDRE